MIQRIALLAGGLGAAAVLAFALGLTSFIFAAPGTTQQTADIQPVAQATDNLVASAGNSGSANDQGRHTQTRKVIDKVYIAPTPPPRTIHVGQNTPTNPPTNNTPPAQPQQPAATNSGHDDGGYDDGGREGHDSEHERGHRGHEDD